MPNHRQTPSSRSITDYLGACAAERPTSHRAETNGPARLKAVAGAAVAAGALLGSVGQLSTAAVATAAPLAPIDHWGPGAPEPVAEEAPAIEEAVAEVPAAAPVAAAPFGLAGLPAEIAGPLAQAEQVIKDLQGQIAAAPAVIAPQIVVPAAPVAPAAPVVLPIAGEISSGFGARWGVFHYGVDIADPLGTPIHSTMGGTVIEAGPADGFGLWVRVLQDDGTTAVYGHVNDIYAHEGKRVEAGEVIASVGNRGNSTGPHLHLEIWDQYGNKTDPVVWLAANGVLMEQHWGAD